MTWQEEKERQEKRKAVEEQPPGNQQRIVIPAALNLFEKHIITGPAYSRQNAQQIAQGIEAELLAAEAYQRDARDGDRKAYIEASPHRLLSAEQAHCHGHKEGRGGDDDAAICGIGVGERNVLQKEIQGYAKKARPREQPFMGSVFEAKPPGLRQRERGNRQEQARGQNLHGRKVPQENGGGQECGSPNKNRKESEQVSLPFRIGQGAHWASPSS